MELFKAMNPNNERKGTQLPFEKLNQVRWLVRGKVLGNLLANWHKLTAYSLCVESNCDTKHQYKVREIKGMLADASLYWYIHFALPIVARYARKI